MPTPTDGAEFLADLLERRERILRANPQAHARIMGVPAPPPAKITAPPASAVIRRPLFERGSFISPTMARIIELVARHSDVSPESIKGDSRVHRLVNARYCIANLAEEFAPRLSARSVDSNMRRGDGICVYYRARHRDRLEMYEDYLAIWERCRAELLEAGRP